MRITAGLRPGRLVRADIEFPLNFAGRTAVCYGGSPDFAKLGAMNPEAIAADLKTALDLARKKLSGSADLPALSFAFVVLSDSSGSLGDGRDLLWRAFQVPVFEYFLDDNGRVAAQECEIHDGLHLVPGCSARVERGELWLRDRSSGLLASICSEQCECGLDTPRIRDIRRPVGVRVAAA
jgi:hypothetical protein